MANRKPKTSNASADEQAVKARLTRALKKAEAAHEAANKAYWTACDRGPYLPTLIHDAKDALRVCTTPEALAKVASLHMRAARRTARLDALKQVEETARKDVRALDDKLYALTPEGKKDAKEEASRLRANEAFRRRDEKENQERQKKQRSDLQRLLTTLDWTVTQTEWDSVLRVMIRNAFDVPEDQQAFVDKIKVVAKRKRPARKPSNG